MPSAMIVTDAPEIAEEALASNGPGPYQLLRQLKEKFPTSVQGRFGRHLSFHLHVTYPDQSDSGSLPLAVLLNGFQCRCGWYREYANHLASWGYAVLQYDTPILKIIPDTAEMECLDQILGTWLDNKIEDPDFELHGKIDTGRKVIAGHSRGGKLAALQFATSDRFKAAFLIDPVDNTRDAPESETSPNACKALRRSGKPFAMVAASIVGAGNPDGSNHKEFHRAGSEGTRLAVLQSVGHQQFLDAGGLLNRGFDWLCKAGQQSRSSVAEFTKDALVLWFDAAVKSPAQGGGAVAMKAFDKLFAAAAENGTIKSNSSRKDILQGHLKTPGTAKGRGGRKYTADGT